MGWLSGAVRAPTERKQDRLLGLLGFHGGNLPDPQYPASTFPSHYLNAFSKNELVYAAIMEKATSGPEAPLRVYGRDGLGDPIESHPLRRLLTAPNPILTEFEMFMLLYMHLDLAGNAFWWMARDRAGRVVELWPLRPDLVRMHVVVYRGTVQSVDSYSYLIDGPGVPFRQNTPSTAEVPLGRDVLHFRLPNPFDPLVGQPPMRAALRAIALDNEATDFAKSLLQNSAVPGTVIKAQQAVDETVARKLKQKWIDAFSGKHRGEPAVLQAGLDVERLGIDPQALEFPDLRTISESRILMVFGVPPILVGAKVGLDRSTFSNTQEARRSFWEETLMPLQRLIRDRIVKDLLPVIAGPRQHNVTVKFDRSEVLALQESEQARWERATQALRAGAIRVSDFLRIVGLPAVEGADIFLRPAGVIPTDAQGKPIFADEQPAQEPRPANDRDLDAARMIVGLLLEKARQPAELERPTITISAADD